MKSIGIDIGTTTISGVVLDDDTKELIQAKTIESNSYINTNHQWEKIQDCSIIIEKAIKILDEFLFYYNDIKAIGIDCQMHGIVYVNQEGKAVSPLYTWQDERGNLLCKDSQESIVERIKRVTGLEIPSGYGLCTHTYHRIHHCIPEGAKKLCTIGDYLGMILTGRKQPLMHVSNACVLGYFDRKLCKFDYEAMKKMNIDISILPELTDQFESLGTYHHIPVSVAIGDNQASFIGAVGFQENIPLLNMGTGGQISILSHQYYEAPGIEARPIGKGMYLLAGSSLCGGRAYALLEMFFRSYIKEATGQDQSQYDVMNRLASKGANQFNDSMEVCTLFSGTRVDSTIRGSITNISESNFSPEGLIYGMLKGMSKELFDMYRIIQEGVDVQAKQIVVSGNGYRKNPILQQISQDMFHLPFTLAPYQEEAACGAAIAAMMQK